MKGSLPRKAARVQLGNPAQAERIDLAFDGAVHILSARGVHGPDRVILDTYDQGPPGKALVVFSREGVVALALAAAFPEGEVTSFFLDAHERHQALAAARQNRLRGVRCLAAPDLPADESHDWVFLGVSGRGNAQLTGELLRQAFSALKSRGKIFVASDNPRDKWAHAKLKELFGAVTIHARDKEGVAYIARKQPGETARQRDTARPFQARLLGVELELVSRPGVFSHGELDAGTLALSEVAEIASDARVLDLGCGSGVLGLAAARSRPEARAILVDSNARAVEVSRRNAVQCGVAERALVVWSHDLACFAAGAVDVALANPPYYGDYRIAEAFVKAARHALRKDGVLYLVTKAFETPLELVRSAFGNAETRTRRGYTVISARKLR